MGIYKKNYPNQQIEIAPFITIIYPYKFSNVY